MVSAVSVNAFPIAHVTENTALQKREKQTKRRNAYLAIFISDALFLSVSLCLSHTYTQHTLSLYPPTHHTLFFSLGHTLCISYSLHNI